MSRSKAREKAFLLLFEAGFHKDREISSFLEEYRAREDASSWADEALYFEDMVKTVAASVTELDAKIKELAIGWKVERISRVARTVLYIALYEIDRCKDIPVKVSINEGVELAKKYDTQEAAAFINGILATYIQKEE
jgi:N utilization substance protein B